MKYSDIFDGKELPDVLSEDEFNYYFKLFKEGDMNARDILILHNIRLVVMVVQNKFSNSDCEFEELFSIGMIGLIKAIDTFDLSMDKKISTYAFRCIQNEILMDFRKNKKCVDAISLDSSILIDGHNPILLGELIEDVDTDLEEDIIKLELGRNLINLIINILTDRERTVIMMYFGFINGKRYRQNEIAKILNIHRSAVSKIVTGALKKIKKEILCNNAVIEIVKDLGYSDEILNFVECDVTTYRKKLVR